MDFPNLLCHVRNFSVVLGVEPRASKEPVMGDIPIPLFTLKQFRKVAKAELELLLWLGKS